MYIKKHQFDYSPMMGENQITNGQNFHLENFDHAESHGVLLIVRIGDKFNFYLPSLDVGHANDDQFNGEIFCIFSHVKDYIYENGLLLIKDNGSLIVIEPNQLSWYLTKANLSERKKSLPRIPYQSTDEIEFLDYQTFKGVFLKVGKKIYYLKNNVSSIEVTGLDGGIRASKLLNTVIVFNKHTENFFENGENSPLYFRVEETEYPFEDSVGYLCFSTYDRLLIKAIRIGMTKPNSSDFDYSYSVEFEEPLKSIKFITRKNVKTAIGCILPDFAIDIWAITSASGKKAFLLQGIGEYKFNQIISKEVLNL